MQRSTMHKEVNNRFIEKLDKSTKRWLVFMTFLLIVIVGICK